MSGELKTNSSAPVLTATPVEPEGPNLLDYLGMFRRRIRTIVVPAILLAILGGVLAVVLPKQYEAETKFIIKDPGLMDGSKGTSSVRMSHKPLLIRAEDEIKSPRFLRPIINRLGISEGYNVARPDEFSELLDYIDRNLKVAIDKARVGPDRVVIRYRGRNQAKVVEFVDSVREAYRDLFRDQFRRPVRESYSTAAKAVEEFERELADLRAEQEKHASSADAALLNQGQRLGREAERLQEQLSNAERDFESTGIRLTKAENQLRARPMDSIQKTLVENEAKKEIGLRLELARGALNELLLKGLTDLTPEVQQARAAVSALEAEFNSVDDVIERPGQIVKDELRLELEGVVFGLKRDLEARQKDISDLKARLKTVNKDLAKIPEVEARDERIRSQIKRVERELGIANQAFGDYRESWESVRDADLFRVLDYPHANDPPVFPSMPIFILIGLVGGLFVGLGLAVMREFSGMTYATAAQVKGAVPIPVLGEVSRIVSEEEMEQERSRRRRNFLIFGLIAGIIGLLHLFYFHEDLSTHMPASLASLMDKIYLGR